MDAPAAFNVLGLLLIAPALPLFPIFGDWPAPTGLFDALY